MYYCRFLTSLSFSDYFSNKGIEASECSSNRRKMACMGAIAITSLGLATWQAVQKKQWMALILIAVGIVLEIALTILYPLRKAVTINPPLVFNTPPDEDLAGKVGGLTLVIKDLEKCYPIKAIDPIEIKNKQA